MESFGKETDNDNIHEQLKTEPASKFDEYRIVQHYVQLRQQQHRQLANCNLSEELKRKLFGFSQEYYLTNPHDPYKLVIQNHPLRGKTIMTEQRHRARLQNRRRERQVSQKMSSSAGTVPNYQKLELESDLDAPFAERLMETHNPEFINNNSQQALKIEKEKERDPML